MSDPEPLPEPPEPVEPPEPATLVDVAHAAAVPVAGGAIPYLAVRDGWRALDWYVRVLGGTRHGEPVAMADGRLGHAEIALPTGLIYLAEEFRNLGTVAPAPGAASVSLVLTVPDVDATVAAAVAAGGRLTRQPDDDHGYRGATVVDPFGHRWLLRTPLPTPAHVDHD